jgi:hypothetical protein
MLVLTVIRVVMLVVMAWVEVKDDAEVVNVRVIPW